MLHSYTIIMHECVVYYSRSESITLRNRFSQEFRSGPKQSDSQDSSNDTGGEDMQVNPEYVFGPQLELLRTLSDEQLNSVPLDYQWVIDKRDDGYMETMMSSAAIVNEETSQLGRTPIQKKLCQRGHEKREDPTYAEIRVDTKRRLHKHGNPTSPVHYTKPHQHLAATTDRHWSITTSPPAVNQPVPYSLPVSSTGSLRNVGLHSTPKSGVRHPTVNNSLSTPEEEPVVLSLAGNSPLQTVNEINSGGQRWYEDENSSDIVTPTIAPTDTSNVVSPISPYAVTPFSLQFKPHPYSKPIVLRSSDCQLSTVTGGSNPSTVQVPVSPKYETIRN